MVVVIAPENDVQDEISILTQLFEAGLGYYHLRKPCKTYDEHSKYLNQIDKKYHNRIVVHFYHELVNTYDLKGIHFQEQKRKDCLDTPSDYFLGLNMYGKTISSSFHDIETLTTTDFEFDYHFLSPIFSSISKKGYTGKGFDVNGIDKTIIGMGGVSTTNLSTFTELGFKGVGVLSSIWHSTSPLTNFKTIHKYFNKTKRYI
jgi:thiamine-phosphate pyrophosphorylase